MDTIAENLFTQEQQDYVAGVKDEDLRFHLLHQTRLCDINGNTAASAIAILTSGFAIDEGYRYAWQANIAMAFVDNVHWYKQETGKKALNRTDIHTIANKAADYFLNQLCKPQSTPDQTTTETTDVEPEQNS